MIVRSIISFIARKLFIKDYALLKEKILLINREVISHRKNNNVSLLERILISGEDHRFFYHCGFDIIAILRAVKNNLIHKKKEGASTIEQQLVRVITNNFQKTIGRKVKEIFLATTLCDLIPKKNIPLLYLHVAYYGPNLYGYQKVLSKLEETKSMQITEEIAAEIIARIKYPELNQKSQVRTNQINKRKQHLINLYKRHQSFKFFKLYAKNS